MCHEPWALNHEPSSRHQASRFKYQDSNIHHQNLKMTSYLIQSYLFERSAPIWAPTVADMWCHLHSGRPLGAHVVQLWYICNVCGVIRIWGGPLGALAVQQSGIREKLENIREKSGFWIWEMPGAIFIVNFSKKEWPNSSVELLCFSLDQ